MALRFRHNRNENTGLSFYQSDFQVLSGLPPVISDIMKNPQFKVVTASLYGRLMADSTLDWIKKGSISAQLSYTSDFVRDYMNTSIAEDKAFLLPELDNFWVPAFQRKGYDAIIARRAFIHFNDLFKAGVVTKDIWKPSPKAVDTATKDRSIISTVTGNKTLLYVGIGAAVLLVGGIFILKRKA